MHLPKPFIFMTVLTAVFLSGCGGEVDSDPDDTPPEAGLAARPTCGPAPLVVTLDASASLEPDTRIIGYAWDFDGDGNDDTLTIESAVTHTYTEVGTLLAEVRVTNRDSLSATDLVEIWVLDVDADPSICAYPNQRMESVRDIEYTLGLDRSAYAPGDTVRFFYRITNDRPGNVEFPLHWTCLADFYVFQGSCNVLNAPPCTKKWQYTDHEVCSNRASTIALTPGDFEVFMVSWRLQTTLTAGRYTAFALLYHGPANPNDSTVVWVGFQVD